MLDEPKVSKDELKARFIALCGSVKRDGMNELLDWLEKNKFYDSPASSRFHGAFAGGLLLHSLNVYEELVRLTNAYPELEFNPESLIVTALFHDLCKVNMYVTEKRNRKNEQGQWESYDAYAIKESFCYGGHGSKSVYLVQHFIDLSPEEATAINCHMSCWDGNKDVGRAFEQFPLAFLLHVADESATYIREK
jgi:hypothetical protein